MAKEGAKISVSDFIFKIGIDIGPLPMEIITPGEYINFGSNDMFRIQIESLSQLGVSKSLKEIVRIRWEVSYKKKDSENFVKIFEVGKLFEHFTGDLPNPKSLVGSDLIGEVKVGFIGDLLEKISFEIYNKIDRGYLSLDAALEYFQCFFL